MALRIAAGVISSWPDSTAARYGTRYPPSDPLMRGGVLWPPDSVEEAR